VVVGEVVGLDEGGVVVSPPGVVVGVAVVTPLGVELVLEEVGGTALHGCCSSRSCATYKLRYPAPNIPSQHYPKGGILESTQDDFRARGNYLPRTRSQILKFCATHLHTSQWNCRCNPYYSC